MNNKKYEILMDEENTIKCGSHTLHRIKALRDFGDVKKGDLGGYVESEYNLSHEGNCWIYDDAKAMDYSRMYDDSKMYDDSEMYDNSAMYNNSEMYDNSEMHNYSKMYDNSEMHDCSKMHNYSKMHDYSNIYDYSNMYNNSRMYGNSAMYGYGELNNNDQLYGKLVSKVDDFTEISNPKGRLVTCVRKGNNIFYNVGCQDEIDEETFKYRIEHENGGLEENPHRTYYYKIIEMAKLYFGK